MNFEDLNALRPDLAFIAHWVGDQAHVLDVGCGDGAMLRYLEKGKRCTGYGIEIADDKVLESTRRGINVIQHDMEQGLEVVNAYAAEHLEIHTVDARERAARVRNAGAVFVVGGGRASACPPRCSPRCRPAAPAPPVPT